MRLRTRLGCMGGISLLAATIFVIACGSDGSAFDDGTGNPPTNEIEGGGPGQFGEGGKVLYQLESEARTIITWDVATGRKLRSVVLQTKPGEMINHFSVHPDGTRILVQVGRIAFDLWLAEGFARPAPAWRRWLQHWVVPFQPPQPPPPLE